MTLSPSDQRVRLHVMDRIIVSGRAPTVAETARALGVAQDDAAATYRRLAEAHALVLAPETLNVWMANPLSAVPTDSRSPWPAAATSATASGTPSGSWPCWPERRGRAGS